MPISFIKQRQNLLLQRKKERRSRGTEKNEIPKFIPNPGSQQELFFDKLGISEAIASYKQAFMIKPDHILKTLIYGIERLSNL